MASGHFVDRCVIIYRDENGYGLTVGGDNPVCVQSVKQDGVARRAGVRAGDRILKVNGTSVTFSNHMDVVQMISGSNDYIALTLSGRSQSIHMDRRHSPASMLGHAPRQSSAGHLMEKLALSQKTAEQPDEVWNGCHRGNSQHNKQPDLRKRRYADLERMYGDELKNIKDLEVRLKVNYCHSDEQLLTRAKRRLKNLAIEFSELKMAFQHQQADSKGANAKQQKLLVNKPALSKSFDSPLYENSKQQQQTKPSEVQVSQANLSVPHAQLRASGKNQKLAACQQAVSAPFEQSVPNSRTLPENLHYVATAQVHIMDDDSDSDTESVVPLETEGPFGNFADLKNRPAHLAVFLHYLLSNCDPSSLLFFLITDLYSSGSSKDLRKWAYEIHSTFLTPTAPLRVSTIDMPVVHEIDAILFSLLTNSGALTAANSGDIDQDEVMRRIFVKARQKSLDEINDLLADFRNKRMLGLGNVYGESKLNGLLTGDISRERKIIDSLLMQHFENFYNGKSDFDQLNDRQQALAISLATMIKHMGVKPSNLFHEKLLEKCPLFVAKEKKTFNLLAKPTKKPAQVKGHNFLLAPVFMTTICYQCQECIWGVNPQGYFCSNCDVIVHKCCAGSLEDACCGAASRLGAKLPSSRFHSRRPAQPPLSHQSATAPVAALPSTFHSADSAGNFSKAVSMRMTSAAVAPHSSTSPASLHFDYAAGGRTIDDMDAAEDEDKTTELPVGGVGTGGSPGRDAWASTSVSADSGYGGDVVGDKSSTSNVVGRSQSMKSHQEEQKMLAKRSGDNGRRAKSDVDTDDQSITMAIQPRVQKSYSSTSSSSMSRTSLPESPSANSAETMLISHPSKPSIDSNASTLTVASCSTTSTLAPQSSQKIVEDSDLEVDNEIPHLEDFLDWETIKMLKPKEKKRQEVVNELFHTERTHVRNMKIVCHIFYEPLLASNLISKDILKLIFQNVEEILDLHNQLNTSMKLMIKQSKLVGDIGAMLLSFFDGPSGEKFKTAVAMFCQNQQQALEVLKLRQKKDPKILLFLQEAESSAICRKLQLKDMLPMEMQRLTKYPLLLETVAKHTHEPSEELDNLKRCVERTKLILDAVNLAKRISENNRRVEELQRRLDTKDFDRMSHPINKEYKNLDLRTKMLIHDGPLTWRLAKNKAVDLHVALMEDVLILLTRNSDGHKLCLKFHNISVISSKDDVKFTHCPLLKLNGMIAKNVATDKKAFFVVSTPAQGPQIYELVAQTASEKKNWFKLITEQIDLCKQRENANAGHNITPVSVLSQRIDAPTGSRVKSAPGTLTGGSSMDEKPGSPSTGEACNVEDLTSVERIEIVNQPRLINPSEVLICQPTVLEHAEPVLTPYERLKRKDDLIIKSLSEKHRILTQTFGLPDDCLDQLSDHFSDSKNNRNAKEMALAAVVQTNRILEAINGAMKLNRSQSDEIRPSSSSVQSNDDAYPSTVSISQPTSGSPRLPSKVVAPPSVSCAALTCIVAPLMKNLTGLLNSLQSMEEDLKRVQTELRLCKMGGANEDRASNERSSNERLASDRCKAISFDAAGCARLKSDDVSIEATMAPQTKKMPAVGTTSVDIALLDTTAKGVLGTEERASRAPVSLRMKLENCMPINNMRAGSSSSDKCSTNVDDCVHQHMRVQSASPQPPPVQSGALTPSAHCSSSPDALDPAGGFVGRPTSPSQQGLKPRPSLCVADPRDVTPIRGETTKLKPPTNLRRNVSQAVDGPLLSACIQNRAECEVKSEKASRAGSQSKSSDKNTFDQLNAHVAFSHASDIVNCASSQEDDAGAIFRRSVDGTCNSVKPRRRSSATTTPSSADEGSSPLASSPLDGDRSWSFDGSGGVVDDRRREKLKQKRQRNAALSRTASKSMTSSATVEAADAPSTEG